MKENEIEINGVKYIRADNVAQSTMAKTNTKGLDYCIVRTYSAGVFAGWYNTKTKGQEGTVYDARRLWYWKGAASLSQMAVDGVSCPAECKFAKPVSEVILKEIIEVLPCTEKAKNNIEGVPEWQV